MKSNHRSSSAKDGSVLGVTLVLLIVLSLLVLALYRLGLYSALEAGYEQNSNQAFWLAEAGRQQCIAALYDGDTGELPETMIANASGTYRVIKDPSNESRRISIGTVAVGTNTVKRSILIDLKFLPGTFENAIYAGGRYNRSGDLPTLRLSGTRSGGIDGPLLPVRNQYIPGGNDIVSGDIDVNGNVRMGGDSRILQVPAPNRYAVKGDVTATGAIDLLDAASIAGGMFKSSVGDYQPPDLGAMSYHDNNDYNVAEIFEDAGISSGRLPSTHPLYGILNVVKNPGNRTTENASTIGDDFYFEPGSVSGSGSPDTAVTPLMLGENKTYYVDGHVWFHNYYTYGFQVDGQAVIVSTRDIHISDNLRYRDRSLGPDADLLALVALGQLDGLGHHNRDGNIYFGDPEYGTLFTADAFMFANNNFYYNTRSNNQDSQEEPESGFRIYGNYMAVNQVVVQRDWYTRDGKRRAAFYDLTDPEGARWEDIEDGTPLTEEEIKTVRHYAMAVAYDDRIRDAATQMSGLPQGTGKIFAGLKSWTEIPVSKTH